MFNVSGNHCLVCGLVYATVREGMLFSCLACVKCCVPTHDVMRSGYRLGREKKQKGRECTLSPFIKISELDTIGVVSVREGV